MSTIDGSSPLHPNILDTFGRRYTHGDVKKDPRLASSAGEQEPKKSDRAEISDSAHQLADLRRAVDVGRAAYAATPDVRQEKVDLVKERLASSYYDSPEVQDAAAGRIAKVLDDS